MISFIMSGILITFVCPGAIAHPEITHYPDAIARPEFTSYPDTSQPKGCTKWVEECNSVCINEKGKIPRSVFYVKLDGGFRIEEWLSVMSVVKFIKPDEITIFGAKRIQGCWWNRTRSFVNLEILPKQAWVRKLNGKKVEKLPHISDFLRLEMLYRRGGIYMDTDVIAMKSFDRLLNKQVVLADEEKYHGVPNVAVMLARKHSCFMCNFMKQACKNFDGDWTTHSVGTLKKMYKRDWKHYKDALLLKLRFGFYPFSWRELHQLFEVNMDKLSFNVSQAYSIHLYHHMASRYLKRLSDYTWISKNPSTAAHVIRSVLPEGFSKKHLDENLCTDLK